MILQKTGGPPREQMSKDDQIKQLKELCSIIESNNVILREKLDLVYKYLQVIENYLRGEHNHETDELQRKEDYELYQKAIELQKLIK